MIAEKWIILQPTYHNGIISPQNLGWTNDPFLITSKFLKAPLYNIKDQNIPLDYDIYWLIQYSIDDLEKEIAFVKQIKSLGKKTFLSFSHDLRFANGSGLMNANGLLWTELCKYVDGIGSGVSDDLKIFGRYQDKTISFGDILLDYNFSKPYNERTIDVLMSGPPGEQFLSFGLETLLLIKKQHPEKRIVCLVQKHHKELIYKLRTLYPEIEFPLEEVKSLIQFMPDAKMYYNPEIRPRPGRAMIEAYYCRVPFICYSGTYFSKLCKEFSYNQMSIVDIVSIYNRFLETDVSEIIQKMEERGQFDSFENVYNRIKNRINL